jgi:hypothetical protein
MAWRFPSDGRLARRVLAVAALVAIATVGVAIALHRRHAAATGFIGSWRFETQTAAADARADWDRRGVDEVERKRREAGLQRLVAQNVLAYTVSFEAGGGATWRYLLAGQEATRGAWVKLNDIEIEFLFGGQTNEGVIIPPSNLVFVWMDGRIWISAPGKFGVPLRHVDPR